MSSARNINDKKEQASANKPDWLKVRLPTGPRYQAIKNIVENNKLHTVCESAACPNRGECWNLGTATFMILGNICTRSCGFCNVQTGKPTELDLDEPVRVAQAVARMKLNYVVITSVNRDELKDGGASVWAQTIKCIKIANESTKVEVLLPDFAGNWEALNTVLSACPDVVNHNIETVPRLYSVVRPQAIFERSLALLALAKEKGFVTKSGLMLGLGETEQEVIEVMERWQAVGCDIITLGQYMQPTKKHLAVVNFVAPAIFDRFRQIGKDMGFKNVFSGPLVRSSYHAAEQAVL